MNIKISTTNINIPKISFRKNDNKQNVTNPTDSKLEKTPQKDTFEMSIGYVNDEHGQTNNMMRILSGLKGDLKLSAGDNDIGDEKRVNAAKLIAELINELPQGVFFKDETGVITSCNLGAIIAGGIQNAVSALVSEGIKSQDYISEINERSSTNIINTDAKACYSIRSASPEKEEELKNLMNG